MNSNKKKTRTGMALAIALVAVGLLLGAQAASAQSLSGGTTEGAICMQRVFMGPTASVTNANQLNCTASDVKIAKAISATNLDTGTNTCTPNTTFNLEATFQVNVTANIRYDEGFFFRIDGTGFARGDGAGATGTCSLSWLDPAASPGDNLDGADGCGDLTAGTYTNVTFRIPNVSCTDDGTGHVRLPNCVSWHSNQGTACNPPLPNSNDFTFNPDTKSKCTCDDTFSIPILVETASLTVVKSAAPSTEPETGGTVTYTVQVTNSASFVSVTINSITDNLYGDLGDTANTDVSNNTCPTKINTVLAPGGSTSCTFDAFVSGNSGDTVTDTAEVCGTDSQGHANLCGNDDADVHITDVFTAPTVAKTAQSTANCQLDATYQVVVSNNSTLDTLTVNALNDDKFGDITTAHAAGGGFAQVVSTTCSLPQQPIATQGNFSCSFVGRIVSTTCSITHTNTVTANVTDDDGVTSTPTDDATVTVTATP